MKHGIPTLHELYDEVLTLLLGKPGQPEDLMDQDLRREHGAHYTNEENILKLLNPLFLDDLWKEFNEVKATPAALDKFHDKIATLKFLDPTCGCGNFLMLAYRELRLLELEILKMKVSTSQKRLDIKKLTASTQIAISYRSRYNTLYELRVFVREKCIPKTLECHFSAEL